MKYYGLLFSLLVSATAVLWPPVCILCPNTLYPIVLTTCVMGVNMNPKPPAKPKREVEEEPEEQDSDQRETFASTLFGGDISSVPNLFEDEDQEQSVPYTILVDGHNVTITNVEEYFVHSDEQQDENSLDEELE
ncbi:UNVERIFIED_CONTAM: hypothetical protein NCL1_41374 [Trichonephila clavipes]